MGKDPAFLFYSQDFIVGVQTMDFEDRGKYITILSQMHQQGRMNEKTIRFLVGSVSDNLKDKFEIDKNGLWYNERLEDEAEKRNKFTKSRRDNGAKGGRPKKEKKPIVKPSALDMDNHMGNEDVNENEVKDEREINFPFDSEKFPKVWNQWKEYKSKEFKFKYKSEISEQAALSKLQRISGNNENVAYAIMKRSVENGWSGLFELTKKESANKSAAMQDYKQKIIDEINEAS